MKFANLFAALSGGTLLFATQFASAMAYESDDLRTAIGILDNWSQHPISSDDCKDLQDRLGNITYVRHDKASSVSEIPTTLLKAKLVNPDQPKNQQDIDYLKEGFTWLYAWIDAKHDCKTHEDRTKASAIAGESATRRLTAYEAQYLFNVARNHNVVSYSDTDTLRLITLCLSQQLSDDEAKTLQAELEDLR